MSQTTQFTPKKVLVIGTGYIGFAVAALLSSRGHHVSATTRKDDTARELQKAEVTPVRGAWQDFGEKKNLDALDSADIVIEAMNDSTDFSANSKLFAIVQESVKRRARPLRFIGTSGCLVYGGTDPEKIYTESDPTPALPARMVYEQAVINAQDIEGVIVRPGWIYGKSFGNYGIVHHWFTGALDASNTSVVSGNPNRKWSWIHVDDNAEAYARLAEAAASVVSHQIFNIGDDTNLSMKELIEGVRKANNTSGGNGVTTAPAGDDFFSQLLEQSCRSSYAKLHKATGWTPRHNLKSDLDFYVKTFNAHHPKK